jgi:hypothetical protein
MKKKKEIRNKYTGGKKNKEHFKVLKRKKEYLFKESFLPFG